MESKRIHRINEVISQRQIAPGILLENVFDPHNIAAVMRTCDSVGMGNIHTLFTEAPPHHLTGFRSSAGAWKWVQILKHENLDSCLVSLKTQYGKVIAAHLGTNALPYYDFDFTQPHALVFGNEQKGCSDRMIEKCDGSIFIPQMGMVQSLNISVACAIILYEAFRQKQAAGHYEIPQLPKVEMDRLFSEWTDAQHIRELKMRKP